MKTHRFSIRPAPPFRLDLTVWVLRRRAANRIDSWDGKTYRRAVVLEDRPVLVEVEQAVAGDSPEICAAISGENVSPALEPAARGALERLLGLCINTADFYAMADRDVMLGPLASLFVGVRPPRFFSLFESIANGIVFQQLSLYAGVTILNRLAEAYGVPIETPDGTRFSFPEPGALAGLSFEEVKRIGVTANKAKAMVEAAGLIAAGGLSLSELESMDNASARDRLVRLRGIGAWTADYVLLRGLGRLDVFPRNDIGARNSLNTWLSPEAKLSDAEVERRLSKWMPFAGFVYFHLLLRKLARDGLIT